MATPHLAPHHGDAGAAETASAARAAPSHPAPATPRLPTPSQTCTPQLAPCCVAGKGHSTSCPPHRSHACTRTTSLHLAMLHTPAALGGLGAHASSALLAYATAHAGLCGTHTTSPTAASTVLSEQGFLHQRFAHARASAHCRTSAVAMGQAAHNNLMLGLCGALCATHTTPAPSSSSSRFHHRLHTHTSSPATLPRLPLVRTPGIHRRASGPPPLVACLQSPTTHPWTPTNLLKTCMVSWNLHRCSCAENANR